MGTRQNISKILNPAEIIKKTKETKKQMEQVENKGQDVDQTKPINEYIICK